MVLAMHDLTSGVFEKLEINSALDFDKRVKYMQHILRGEAIKKQDSPGEVKGLGKGN